MCSPIFTCDALPRSRQATEGARSASHVWESVMREAVQAVDDAGLKREGVMFEHFPGAVHAPEDIRRARLEDAGAGDPGRVYVFEAVDLGGEAEEAHLRLARPDVQRPLILEDGGLLALFQRRHFPVQLGLTLLQPALQPLHFLAPTLRFLL